MNKINKLLQNNEHLEDLAYWSFKDAENTSLKQNILMEWPIAWVTEEVVIYLVIILVIILLFNISITSLYMLMSSEASSEFDQSSLSIKKWDVV